MDKKLEVKNLQISFRTQGGILKAVRNISFDLYQGETLAIVGESGSGKSVTSKAIMGILAGNSIVEGGEILYDGQDLLKISEEDFHKLRGDKVAMIFQDPMSSLNPIMRVGQQLTEAMILKARAGKKNARRAFNGLLATLGKYINAAQAELGLAEEAVVAEKLSKFDSFCISAIQIERLFNEANGAAIELEMDAENMLLMLKKQLRANIPGELKRIQKYFTRVYNPYVVVANEDTKGIEVSLLELIQQGKEFDADQATETFTSILALVKEALAKEKPNFFTLGYYKMENPDADLSTMSIADMNAMTRAYLDEHFMNDFIAMAEAGVSYSHRESIARKQELLAALAEMLQYFQTADPIDEKQAKAYAKGVSAMVTAAIDRLNVKKASVEYVFPSAINAAIKQYFNGVRNNPIEEKKYLRNKAKYDAILAKGQQPDWVLTPQVVVDLDLQRENICKVISNLHRHYEKDIAANSQFDSNASVIDIIDYLKDQASKFVVKMNKRIAKAKAIKLLEEVGIPEPSTRFRQYPFEFSGGMRQRIVIAIALSANPDILICDEPTTALDVTIQAQILELINNIKEKRKLSVIFITHNMGVVANMADRIAVMYAGKIVEHGTAEEIFYEPAHPYTWALLSSMPDLETTEKLESIPGTPPNMIYPPKGDAFAARNKYAMEIDFELDPPLFEITPTHYAATWLLHPNAPKVEMPELIRARIARAKKEVK